MFSPHCSKTWVTVSDLVLLHVDDNEILCYLCSPGLRCGANPPLTSHSLKWSLHSFAAYGAML